MTGLPPPPAEAASPDGEAAGVFVVTPALVVASWNTTMVRWTGLEAEAAVGSDLCAHFPQFRRSQLRLRLAGVFAGGPPVVLSAGIHGNVVSGGPSDEVPRVQHTTVVAVPASDGSGQTWASFSVDDVSDLFGRTGEQGESARAGEDPGAAARVEGTRAGRVLLAEDDRVNRLVAERQLHVLGWAVDVVANGADAVAAIAANPGLYDLVLMDCHMPVMDGFAATRAIREAEAGACSRSRIVAMTASDLDADRRACLDAGMDGFVPKPVRPDELERLLAG